MQIRMTNSVSNPDRIWYLTNDQSNQFYIISGVLPTWQQDLVDALNETGDCLTSFYHLANMITMGQPKSLHDCGEHAAWRAAENAKILEQLGLHDRQRELRDRLGYPRLSESLGVDYREITSLTN